MFIFKSSLSLFILLPSLFNTKLLLSTSSQILAIRFQAPLHHSIPLEKLYPSIPKFHQFGSLFLELGSKEKFEFLRIVKDSEFLSSSEVNSFNPIPFPSFRTKPYRNPCRNAYGGRKWVEFGKILRLG